ncbi:MAG: WbqC family protein [Planctomycetota bacterium]
MILTGHQPNYLPYPGFFQKIAAADTFLVVDTTQFVKRGPFGWIHRNRISTPNGPIWLSLPVLHKGRYEQPIQEAEFNPRIDWRQKHWRSIAWNYSQAPYWERYSASLEELYQRPWTHLSPFTTAVIRWFLEHLQLGAEVRLASELRARGQSTAYIVAFCQELGATTYLSGAHGRDYLELPRFSQAGIELRFQDYTPPRYDNRAGPAEENLSMLDMLFWCGDQAVEWVHQVPEFSHA